MSLDITLTKKGRITFDGGLTFEDYNTEVFEKNITHNLTTMAEKAGLYGVMWRPEEIGIITAKEALPLLEKGLKELIDFPEEFKKYNPENGWGSYDGFVSAVQQYIDACKEFPEAHISVCR